MISNIIKKVTGGNMKKIIVTVIIGVLLLSSFTITSAFGDSLDQISINFNGNTLYVGGLGPGNYTTIQDAIDDANDGDTVYVFSGIYYENIIIDRSICLIGENKKTTIIDADEKGAAIELCTSGIDVSGFTITNAEGKKWIDYAAGVKLSASHNIIHDNIISNNMFGIHGWNVTNITIYNNIFIDDGIQFGHAIANSKKEHFMHNITNNTVNGRPIYYYKNKDDFSVPENAGQIIAVNCTNMQIQNVYISHTDFPIILTFCSNCTIENSTIVDNDGEIWLAYCSNNTVQKNTISNCAIGICLQHKSKNNTVKNNKITNCDPFGISIETNSYNNHIYENHVMGNLKGIWIHKSHNNTISLNTISKSLRGGILLMGTTYNSIICNNLIKNRFLDACYVNGCGDLWDGNYWDRPRILPKPILELTGPNEIYFRSPIPFPAILTGLNFDWHPAKEPHKIDVM